MKKILNTAATVLMTAAFATSVHAASVVTPDIADGSTANRFPFWDSGMRYQQVFDASLLSSVDGTGAISEIGFRCDSVFCEAFTASYTNVTISLSTIVAGENSLSTTFADNIGADVVEVFNGALTLSSMGAGLFDIVIDVANTFTFDSSLGNLLMDITVVGGPDNEEIFFDANDASDDGTSRLFATSSTSLTGAQDSVGLITRFTTSEPVAAVPLPAGLPLLLAALGGLGLVRRRYS